MKEKERRIAKRSSIRVLVKCLPPGVPSKRNGHEAKGWEMWARNIGDDGVGLQWSRRWAVQRCPRCSMGLPFSEKHDRRLCLCTSPHESLKQGQHVELDGLVYNDKGSKTMRGRIQWVRPDKKGETYEVGIHITSPNHRSFFRTLEAI